MHTNIIQSIFALYVAFEDISSTKTSSSSSFFDAQKSEWAGKTYDASTNNLQLRGIVICDMLS